jgi:hypothetical protein
MAAKYRIVGESAPAPEPPPALEPRQKHGGGHIWFREVWILVTLITGVLLGAAGYHVAMMTAFPVAERTILHSMAISSAVKGGE